MVKKRLLILEPSGQRILVPEKTSYLHAIRESGLYVPSECGGRGTCRKCKVVIRPSPETTECEKQHLPNEEIEQGIRLACKHTIETDSRIVLLNTTSEAKILTEGRSGEVDVITDNTLSGQYGAAIDIGTTTIVVYLMHLETGQQIASASTVNPQVAFGEDIVTRLKAASESELNQKTLQHLVVENIEKMISNLLNETKIKPKDCTKLSVVGNTAMHHFFLGLDTSTLNVAPYTPALTEAKEVRAKPLGFKEIDADIYCGPLIAGFVGSDITSLIISQNLQGSDEVVLGIDIGTNGEIVLSNEGNLFACSTAAGSAFEGATISQGMRGQVGAIEHLTIQNSKEAPDMTVIGHVDPRGLCGSAIVDIVSELRRVNLLSPEGRLQEGPRIIRDNEAGLGYVVVDKHEFNLRNRILFTQKDVRQVQLAKAAIIAGNRILMRIAGVDELAIDRILLAGAFGNYIEPKSALRIGLIPDIPMERIQQVGNTAGQGAKMMLLSSAKRMLAEEVTKSIIHVELAGNPEFQEDFIDATLFPRFSKELSR